MDSPAQMATCEIEGCGREVDVLESVWLAFKTVTWGADREVVLCCKAHTEDEMPKKRPQRGE